MTEDRKIDISGAIFITRCLTDPQSGEVFANHQTALVWLLNSVRLIIVLTIPLLRTYFPDFVWLAPGRS
jgi:hypothetical protein